MRKIMTGLAASLALICGSLTASAQETLRIAAEGAFPPFSAKAADGSLYGFDIDIANAICAELKVKCEISEQDWDGMIPALISKKFDAIVASMSITEERLKRVDFTNKYYASTAALAAPAAASYALDADGTAGKSIGVQRGTVQECYVQKVFPKATMKQYQTSDEAFLDLAAGRIDGALVDSVPVLEWLKTNPGYKALADAIEDKQCFGEGIGIAVRKGDAKLLERLNGAIAAIRANGVYKTINDKYFTFDIYGK